jgi:hypothetical protein
MSENRPIVVPQTDPKGGNLGHQAEIDAAVHRVMESGSCIRGREVAPGRDTQVGRCHALKFDSLPSAVGGFSRPLQ